MAIGNKAVVTLATNCPNLATVRLSSSGIRGDSSVVALARNCPKLTTIAINFCTDLTDASTQALVAGCPNLTNINISHNRGISDPSVLSLARGPQALSVVDYSSCDMWISDAAEDELLEAKREHLVSLNESNSRILSAVLLGGLGLAPPMPGLGGGGGGCATH